MEKTRRIALRKVPNGENKEDTVVLRMVHNGENWEDIFEDGS